MSSEINYKFSFVWWNTSLAPSGKTRSKESDRKVVCDIVEYLVKTKGIDFIALGEMSDFDIDYLQKNCDLNDYKFITGVSKAGRSTFSTLFIYNAMKIVVSPPMDIVSTKGSQTLRIAQKLDIIVANSLLHVLVSHWPSRMYCDENSPDRQTLGMRLRDEVDSIIDQYVSNPHVLLLGDYNDEPFDKSISEQLMATRDIDLVEKKTSLLYNPFWKCLSMHSSNKGSSGSYFYKSGIYTRWHTFDQIIYSHAFVEAKEWKLGEEVEHIIDIPGYIEHVKNNKTKFDHLPVSGQIERVL